MSEHSSPFLGTSVGAGAPGAAIETAAKPTRREALVVIGTATAGSLAAGCGGTMSTGQCMGDPPSTAIIVTTAEQQAADKDKVSRVGDTIVYITKDDKGYMAIDSRCQHAGCPTVPEKGTDGSYVGFVCGCHGSKYFLDGKVKNGPTVKPLVHPTMCRRASDGALAIDLLTPASIDDRVT